MNDRFMSMKEVRTKVPFSKTHIYKMIDAGTFPRPKKIGVKRIAFLESDIVAWMGSRKATGGEE